MRPAHLFGAACIAILAAVRGAGAGDAWTLDSQIDRNGKSCSLSKMDRGRTFSIKLAFLDDRTDQGVIGLAFDEPKLIQGANKALATLEFDNGTSESHRIEVTPGGLLLVPIVALQLQNVLQTFSDSERLTVATHFGSTTFSLDGIADHIPALRKCAGR
jgi:hypothetical protein